MPRAKRPGAKAKRAAGSGGAAESCIMVGVRVRPLLGHDRKKQNLVKIMDRKMVVVMDPDKVNDVNDPLRKDRTREKKYAFDHVFGPEDDSAFVHRSTTHTLINGVIDGYNATVFAYGQTGSGKTHTMIGTPQDLSLIHI